MDSFSYFSDVQMLRADSILIEIPDRAIFIEAIPIGLANIRPPKTGPYKLKSFNFRMSAEQAEDLLKRILAVRGSISREAKDYLATSSSQVVEHG